jgi:hypothetical protein
MLGRRTASISVFLLVLAGCSASGEFGGAPMIWPKTACPGATVGLVVDSNYVPYPLEHVEFPNLSPGDVSIRIKQTVGSRQVAIRALVGGAALPTSFFGEAKPGSSVSIAVFDLPTDLESGPGWDVWFVWEPPGGGSWAPWKTPGFVISPLPKIKVLSCTQPDTPVAFFGQLDQDLQPLPMLRLRALPDQGGAPQNPDGFVPTWEIGSIEFELSFPNTAVQNPRVRTATEAASSLAVVGPGAASNSVRVYLVAPNGIQFSEAGSLDGLGQGPFLDVVFDKSGPFQTDQFDIWDLYVTDPDGDVLIDRRGDPEPSTTYFALYTVNEE